MTGEGVGGGEGITKEIDYGQRGQETTEEDEKAQT
jgi:hypothetical protein